MDNAQKLEIYKAQVENLRALESAFVLQKRVVNGFIRRKQRPDIIQATKILALIYCAWSESLFLKTIFTPYSFALANVEVILSEKEQNGVTKGWREAFRVGLLAVKAKNDGKFKSNMMLKVVRFLKTYVQEPSELRNKIAHGQWAKALNSKSTAVNQETTQRLFDLNVVSIAKLKTGMTKIANVLESLVESPDKAFHSEYWTSITELEDFVEKSKDWSMTSLEMRLKPIRKN